MMEQRTVESMLNQAREVCVGWRQEMENLLSIHGLKAKNDKEFLGILRNLNALRGVVKTLEWVLEESGDNPLF